MEAEARPLGHGRRFGQVPLRQLPSALHRARAVGEDSVGALRRPRSAPLGGEESSAREEARAAADGASAGPSAPRRKQQ